MRKPYSLDFNLETDKERLALICETLDTLTSTPSPADLELMASYILYGKDENGQNAIQRRECIEVNKRYGTFKRRDETNESLEKVLDNPMTDQATIKPVNERYIYIRKVEPIHKPRYSKTTGKLVDPGYLLVPGMIELWESIDRIAHTVAVNDGLVEDPTTEILTPYRLMQLRHQLIDLRKHQYYLRDSFYPTIHPLKLVPPKPQTYNWDQDNAYWVSIEEWERKLNNSYLTSISRDIRDYPTRIRNGRIEVRWHVRAHHFDWENPLHIRCLMSFYSAIAQQLQEKLYADGRYLIMDLDRYATLAHLSPVRQYIMDRYIDKADPVDVSAELREKFDVDYSATHVAHIGAAEIPTEIAKVARKLRLIMECPPTSKKRCSVCHCWLPRSDVFFTRHARHKDGFSSACKECERARRMNKTRGGKEIDYRYKDTQMRQMQGRKV